MRKVFIIAFCMLFTALPAFAGKDKKVELKTKKDKTSYAIGYNTGIGLTRNIEGQSLDIDLDLVMRGIKDAFVKAAPLMKEEDMRDILLGLQKDLDEKRKETMAKQQEKMKEQGEKNKKEGEKFLAENAKKEGVKVLPSGLQYKILAEGKGKQPTANDTVTVNYKGTLIDGTEFDSSYKRGTPATFPLNRVIKGWTEGIQLVHEGGKIQLFIPSALAYGEHGAGPVIGPDATLIFDVELISVQSQTGGTK
jgi:FKBP-type peptidyl-prolyl cis-trans isomerase FklB